MILKDKIVGLSEIYVGKEGENIITVGLGSCVGVIIYDDKNKIFGLAHIMLSDSTQFKNVQNIGKYVDLAIPELIRQVIKNGALRKNLKCKLTGGASMCNKGKGGSPKRKNRNYIRRCIWEKRKNY